MTSRAPTEADKRRWSAIVALGCIVGIMRGIHGCKGRSTVHHCGTGGGGRKNHAYTICLCLEHHQGPKGIDGQLVSKKKWQERYGTELALYNKTEELLNESREF